MRKVIQKSREFRICFREAFNLIKNHIWIIFTISATLWSGLSGVTLFSENKTPYFIVIVLGLISIVVFLISGMIKISKKTFDIPVGKAMNRHLSLMKDDFCENMDIILKDKNYRDKRVFFAMGIDRSGDLSVSTKAGILHSVLLYLQKEYDITEDEVQDYISKAIKKQLKNKKKLDFGDAIVVYIPIPTEIKYLRLLLIATSQKSKIGQKLKDKELVEGIDSRIIVLKLFKKCEKIKCDTLVVGAIGTNGLGFPYEVVMTEILNAYVFSLKEKKCPNNVIISMRTKDMERHGIKHNELVVYTRHILALYK